MIRTILVWLCVGFVLRTEQAVSKTVLCYYESWVADNSGHGKFTPSNIPPKACSHVTYAFILPQKDGSISPFNDAATLNQLTALRKSNSKLKVLVSIGGWSAGSAEFSSIVRNSDTRTKFVNNLAAFVSTHNLDGIDIDWEYPTQRDGSNSADNANYISLLSELRTKWGTSKVITAAVGADRSLIGGAYNVREMSKYLDFINLMTYDFNGWVGEGSRTGQNSPLYAGNADSDKTLNQAAAVEEWIAAGAAPAKLLLGLAFYGHNFQLANANNHGLGAKASGPGNKGPYTDEAGYKGYSEICMDFKQSGWTQVYDQQQQSPYAYNGNQWIGYDNPTSIAAKAQYAVNRGLGGVMMWAVDNDDLYGDCGGGALPLLKALNSVIQP